ncbi:amino acid ABC transporter permease [Radicibacter daui]|uniref:amino acid ABC transporter permease n=1 Tax=Radicibacter daui TaxID=3064829 RepID=UPI004046C5D7
MTQLECLPTRMPRQFGQWWAGLRQQYFPTRGATLINLLLGVLSLAGLGAALDWGIFSAAWLPGGPEICAAHSGACWAFLWEKWQVILLGAFPRNAMWRPLLGVGVVVIVLVTLARLRWPARTSIVMLAVAFAGLFALLDGRPLGLEQVEMVRWHGIAVVTFLGVFSLFAAFPVGILLALMRVDGPPLLSWLATGYVEVVRAVPLVTVLFFGVFVLPLLLPPSLKYPPLLVTLLALILFNAAYFAEDIRGGLQAVPRGQYQAAESLGLGYLARIRCIILPQAISVAIPALTNTIIGAFKDTSLVAMVGIFDLLATTRMAFSDPVWQRQAPEGLVIVGLLYLGACWAIARHSRTMERHVAGWLGNGR